LTHPGIDVLRIVTIYVFVKSTYGDKSETAGGHL
jgi:hypothetical protein